MGQDVFQFTYYAPNVGISNDKCPNVGLYDKSLFNNVNCNTTRESLLNNCAVGKNGISCGELIIKDGWKISKDYPWDYAQKKID